MKLGDDFLLPQVRSEREEIKTACIFCIRVLLTLRTLFRLQLCAALLHHH